jgi:hypothetical protein
VVGLAPSAAAAAQLRDATGAPAETLAKLTWSIHHKDLPDWAERIGRSTLVIIDEAGMADTLSLDTVFDAWQNDCSRGLDPIMLAPTRELVRSLNQRAQDHRLAVLSAGRSS